MTYVVPVVVCVAFLPHLTSHQSISVLRQCARVCVCVLAGGRGGLFEVACLLRLCVVRQTDRHTDRQGWTDTLWQAKQQVCLLNVSRRHMNALFTFSPADSCFHQQKKRVLLLCVAGSFICGRDRQPLSLCLYVRPYCLSSFMLLFLYLVMARPGPYIAVPCY